VPALRINKAIATAGAASRRGAEDLIRAGRVKLNGLVVTDLATTVNPARDQLTLDGKPLKLGMQQTYYLFHKPRGLITTMKDEEGRACVGELCGRLPGNPKPVGRLDRASEGVMLLTSDGELANRLTHPRYGIRKDYQVTIEPRLKNVDANKMTSGVELEDGVAKFEGIVMEGEDPDRSRILVTVTEGRNRLIRRVCESLGYKVRRLRRIRFGPLTLGKLELNDTRPLTTDEVEQLKRITGMIEGRKKRNADEGGDAAKGGRRPAPKAGSRPERPRKR
jgi:23S rRNA pseudouridine2605 synthase